MSSIAIWLARLVGALHVLIGGSEISRARTMVTDFGFEDEIDKASLVLMNAGLYNLFLALLIFWALRQAERNRTLLIICLGFAAIAGIFGTATLSSLRPVVLQTVPAAIALVAIMRRST